MDVPCRVDDSLMSRSRTDPSGDTPVRSRTLRAAREADIEQVTAIEQVSFSDPWTAGSFRSLLGNPHVHFAVAVDGEHVVGYIVAWFVFDEAEVANLAVAQAVRGQGVGASLLDAALAAAGRRNIEAVFLEVRESNAAARALYGSRAFVEVGRRRAYYRRPVEDAVVMRRTLSAEGS